MNPEASAVLLSFFTDPKPTYTREDVAPLFDADTLADMFDAADVEDRETVASFIRDEINPAIVGEIVAKVAPACDLAPETVAVTLPRWVIRALREVANEREMSFDALLSEELVSSFSGAFASSLGSYVPVLQYADVTISGEVKR